MGNQLCNGQPQDLELEKVDDYNPDQEHPDEQINKIIRKGEPSQRVGYNINNLPDFFKESSELTKLQQKITKLMSHQKRNSKPMKISKNENENNKLPDPYYIRAIQAIYVGQWVLDKDVNQVVPGGLGRLYTDQKIYEGQMMTVMNSRQSFFDDDDIDFTQRMVAHNKEKATFFSIIPEKKTKLQKQVYQYQSDQFLNINVVLHGQGRCFTRLTQLRGNFINGQLSGKGYCRIKDGQDVYEYTGQFKNGKKNGKGLEKFKLTTYDGDFQNDKKKGKGTLTLLISKAYQKQRLQEEAQLAIQDKQKQPSQKIIAVKNFLSLKSKFQKKLFDQIQRYYKWTPPHPLPGKSIIQNQNFFIQHHRKIKFQQHYKGHFLNNQFHGHGTYTWFNGKCYNGIWSEGKMEGLGEFYWPKGIAYKGEYEKDMRHGKGEMIWNLHKRFRGSWAYGMRHGYGQLIEIVEEKKKLDEEWLQARQENNELKVKQIEQQQLELRNRQNKAKQNKQKLPKRYFLRVIGALFNRDKMTQPPFFKKFTLIEEDLKLDQLIFQEKKTIAFVKDIKIDLKLQD